MKLTPEDLAAYDRISAHIMDYDQCHDDLICQAAKAIDALAAHIRTIEAENERLRSRTRPLPNAIMQTTPTNCFRACVAEVLSMDIERVPAACDGASWDWMAFEHWLGDQGWQAVEMTFGTGATLYPVSHPVRCIVTGQSPRECTTGRHAVVADFTGLDGFTLLHDPHPSQLWIDGEPTHAVFFVPLRSQLPAPQSPEMVANCAMVVRAVQDGFTAMDCGTWAYWPVGWGGGCFTAWALRAIADELDKRNEDAKKGGEA